MKNSFYDFDQDFDANFYDTEISFNMEEQQLYDEVIFESSSNFDDDDDDDGASHNDWGQVDPQEDCTPSDNDPSGPGSAV